MVTDNPDGSLTFRVYNPHADSLVIHGDFTPPEGTPMQRGADGWWEVTLRIAPGDHTFRYIVNGHASVPDYAASGLALDGHGSWVSCLCVAPDPVAEPPRAEPRRLTITDAELALLMAGRHVELRPEKGEEGPVVLVRSPHPGGRAEGGTGEIAATGPELGPGRVRRTRRGGRSPAR